MDLKLEGMCLLLEVFDMPTSLLMLNTQYEKQARPLAPDPGRVAARIELEPPPVRDYGMRQLSFSDPDGYTPRFQWPAD